MGIPLSCPFAEYSDLETVLLSVIVKSISFGDDEVKTNTRSISFSGQNSEPTIMTSLGSGKMIIEGSVNFERRERDTMVSIKAPSQHKEKNSLKRSIDTRSEETDNQSPRPDSLQLVNTCPGDSKYEAALKWKLLDFVELKRSSISFFDIEKHETAISRWSRARTRAAKVGKGLSKDGKAQKLALQHWLEAIDPRHRYGHNLHFYYVKWLQSQSREPFFYWLDIGEGKEVNLVEKCPRSKLQQQCIKYLGPMERKAYEIVVENGQLFYKKTGELVDTTGEPKDAKWIFVLSTSRTLYVGMKKKGTFQHSSFLAGGATSAAGRLVVEKGILKAVWPHSGHYRPTQENFLDFLSFLRENNVDLTDVKMGSVDEEEKSLHKQRSSIGLSSNSSEEDLTQNMSGSETEETNVEDLTQENTDSMEEQTVPSLGRSQSRRFLSLSRKLTNLKIPERGELFDRLESENPGVGPSGSDSSPESPSGSYETAEESFNSDRVQKQNLFDEEQEEDETETIPEESILQRINSRKGMDSYQLGKQLFCKWTTGAGPRIGCVRDYPSKLQVRALEQVNLSPRSAALRRSLLFSPQSTSGLSPNVSTTNNCGTTCSPSFERGNLSQRIIQQSRTQYSPLRKWNSTRSDPS
ncbi:hypothetical protein L1049_019154 [Liquidambar formosana]|uniref:IQ domain-containing protein IQM2-like n=1 Tax=Liquidambar formosana TaxID=63359 RepID=A0AAP0RC56_LIQFO